MTLKQYLVIMILGTCLCFVSLAFVLINIDPFVDTGIGFLFFYLSLFFSLLGFFSILLFVYHYFAKRESLPMFKFVQASFQQSFLVSFVVLFLLYLQGKNYIRWWNALTIVVLVLLLAVFKVANKKNVQIDQENFN